MQSLVQRMDFFCGRSAVKLRHCLISLNNGVSLRAKTSSKGSTVFIHQTESSPNPHGIGASAVNQLCLVITPDGVYLFM